MIKIEQTETYGWEAAIRGMRNPMNSWDKSDTKICDTYKVNECCDGWVYDKCLYHDSCGKGVWINEFQSVHLGENDLNLMKNLCKAGTDHRKFMRMIIVYCDIAAPLYWWKEFDTYKVGTVANSCSTMHKIAAKEFMLDDFSYEHLNIRTRKILEDIVDALNNYRNFYINYNPDDFEIHGCPSKKDIWWQMIQLLPSSYNQKRTLMMNYEVLVNMYKSRKSHKLDEWRKFCDWVETLPYSELITGERNNNEELRMSPCFV